MSDEVKCTNHELCDYRFSQLSTKLDELHDDIKDLHKTVRNGISQKIGECHTELTRQGSHINMHWWFIGAILLAIGLSLIHI